MAVFSNQARLSYNGTVTDSNIVTGEIIEILSATKSSLQTNYTNDDTITYLVSIVNSGTSAVSGVTVTDDLGAFDLDGVQVVPLTYVDGSAKYFTNGALQGNPTVTDGPPLVISGITVPADGNVLVIYQARTNEFAPLATGSEITNIATVTGATISAPITASNTLSVQDTAALTITKALSPSTVVEDGEITYTFVIQNTGNTAATDVDNVAITDTFDPILSNITVTLDGTIIATPTDYTYNEATGEFATVAGRITVPAATYTQDPATGEITIVPGTAVLTVTGTV